MATTAPAVRVCYSGGIDTDDWTRRHLAGAVPDALPYGLDRLARHGLTVRAAPAHAARRPLSRALGRLLPGHEWPPPRLSAGEIAVCWDERAGIPVALRAGRRAALGVIWLTEPARTPGRADPLARRALQRASVVWALSTAQLEPLRSWGAADPRWLPFGVDAGFWAPGGGGPRPGRVLSVGNDRHRDHLTLVSALEQVRRRSRPIDLLLATRRAVDVPDALGRRAAALPHDELRREYRTAQVVAIATTPNLHCSGITAILEAMACARPVVATRTPGMEDYVRDGVDGLLVAPGDPGELAAAVEGLLADPTACERMGQAGRRQVEERFSTETMTRDLAALLAPLR